jgi:hypothetical protein
MEENMRPRGTEFGVYPKKIHDVYIFYYWVYGADGKRVFGQQAKETEMKL